MDRRRTGPAATGAGEREAMYLKMAKRFLLETDKRLAWKFFRIMGLGGVRSVMKYRSRLKRGEFFPPFLYVSIINSCNLRCQGCWVDVAAKQERIDIEAMSKLITEAQAMGNVFFGIVGWCVMIAEPFLSFLNCKWKAHPLS